MNIDFVSRNNSLKKVHLDSGICYDKVNGVELKPLYFWKINGLARFWDGRDDFSMSRVMKSVLCGIAQTSGTENSFVYMIVGTGSGIDIYVGSDRPELNMSFISAFPVIDITRSTDEFLCGLPDDKGGMFNGIPSCGAEKLGGDCIDEICRGMQGKRFCYAVYAQSHTSLF